MIVLYLSFTRRYLTLEEETTAPINPTELEFRPGTDTHIDSFESSTKLALIGNDQLPGSVLTARARLLECLRGVTLSENRDNGIDVALSEQSSIAQTLVTLPLDLTSQLRILQEQSRRVSGLSREAVDVLNQEVFRAPRREVQVIVVYALRVSKMGMILFICYVIIDFMVHAYIPGFELPGTA